jgi:hypothetical protein
VFKCDAVSYRQPWFSEHRIHTWALLDSVITRAVWWFLQIQSLIYESQLLFLYIVCLTEESSRGLVRFKACELNRRGTQKVWDGKWVSGSQFISTARSHLGPVICSLPHSLSWPN